MCINARQEELLSGCNLGPRAWSRLAASADYKVCAADFRVDEILEFEPLGEGEHLYLNVQKVGENTAFVARALARAMNLGPASVSYAGMKDRHALTSQWFSLHMPGVESPDVRDGKLFDMSNLENVQIRKISRHTKKLRRGQIRCNEFCLRLSNVVGDQRALSERLDMLSQKGFPNYFGPQRFGENNLKLAVEWLPNRRKQGIPKFNKSLYISVLRSFLFNQVLAKRIENNCWQNSIDGDLDENASPTATLWGRGRTRLEGEALQLEQKVLQKYVEWLDDLEHVGLKMEQRTLLERPEKLKWRFENNSLVMSFALGKGVYATSLLRELLDATDANPYARTEPGTGIT